MALVEYEEMEGSPTYKLTPKNITAQRRLKYNWDDTDMLVAEFSPTPGNIFASFPGRPLLWVDSISIEPYPGCPPINPEDEFPNRYEHGQATIDYKTVDWDGSPDGSTGFDPASDTSPRQGGDPQSNSSVLLSHKTSIGGEFIVLHNKGLEWELPYNVSGAYYGMPGKKEVADDVGAGILVPTKEHTITWHYVRYPPWTAIARTVGKINKKNFAGCPPGTLLFLGCEASIDISTGEIKWWTLEYKFAFKNYRRVDGGDGFDFDKGWNYFFRPESGAFEQLFKKAKTKPVITHGTIGNPNEKIITKITVGKKTPIYESIDFMPLFQIALV